MKGIISSVFVVLLCTREILSSCPSGSTAFSGRCFVAGKSTVKFTHAYNYCIALGCKMAVPSAALKSQIQGFASQAGVNSNVAFGVMDTLEEGQFIEAPTGELFGDLVWQSGKPTGSTSNNCIRMQSVSNWKMEDVSCTSSNNFICDCGDEST